LLGVPGGRWARGNEVRARVREGGGGLGWGGGSALREEEYG
jgi:hypothetical protein